MTRAPEGTIPRGAQDCGHLSSEGLVAIAEWA